MRVEVFILVIGGSNLQLMYTERYQNLSRRCPVYLGMKSGVISHPVTVISKCLCHILGLNRELPHT